MRLQVYSRFMMLWNTIAIAMDQIIPFFIVYFMILFAFAQGGTLLACCFSRCGCCGTW